MNPTFVMGAYDTTATQELSYRIRESGPKGWSVNMWVSPDENGNPRHRYILRENGYYLAESLDLSGIISRLNPS